MTILKCAFKKIVLFRQITYICHAFVYKMAIVAVCFSFLFNAHVRAEQSKVNEASIQLYCAMADMLVYKSQLNEAIREVSSEFGYEIITFSNENRKATTNFYLFRSSKPDDNSKKYTNILAIPGTEKMKDVEVDLRFGKVLFGGKSPEEFEDFAKITETTSQQPLVHRGFNDYTQTAFFTSDNEGKMGVDKVWEILKNDDNRLILTGHSLGGAVAVLLGSRLECMGAPAEKYEIVTFGAPAVGNQVFADVHYADLKHTRYTMSGDPVHSVLQSIKAGYVQTGQEIKCKRNPNSYRFSHSMSEYLDYSFRNYLDVLQEEGIEYNNYVKEPEKRDAFGLTTKTVKDRIYVTPAKVTLPDELLNDESYMSGLTEMLADFGFKEAVKAQETEPDLQLKEAQRTGCDKISMVYIDAKQIKRNVYQVTVNEEITDRYGNIVSTQTCGTTTDNVSPIEAVFFDMSRCVTSRQMLK